MNPRVPRLVYWNNIPTPYVEGRFAALARRGNVSFEAWFNDRTEPDRSWMIEESQWQFEGRYIPEIRLTDRHALHVPLAELGQVCPDVLISLFSSASFALGSMLAASMGSRVVWRVLPTFDTWIKRTIPKEMAKHVLFRALDGAKVPGPDGAAVAAKYGVPEGRIFFSTQSIDVDHFARADLSPDDGGGSQGIHLQKPVLMYVGRVLAIKGLDTLIEAYRAIRNEERASLAIVGSGADEPRYRRLTAELPDVHFLGFHPPTEMPRIYQAADIVVLPTLGDPHGLVVDEAMAASKAVVATDAVGDIRLRIEDGRSGLVVPPGDPQQLASAVLGLLRDPDRRRSMGEEAAQRARMRSHERWAEDVERLVDEVMRMPRRASPSAAGFRIGGNLLRAAMSLSRRGSS